MENISAGLPENTFGREIYITKQGQESAGDKKQQGDRKTEGTEYAPRITRKWDIRGLYFTGGKTVYEKIPTAGMDRKAWLQLRRTGIGGSDAGAVCGIDPYRSAMKVFRDKTEEISEETNNEAVRIGHDLEQYVAERFMEQTGLKVRRSNYMYRSREHPFMIADVDRLVIGEDAGLECKTASAYNASKWEDGRIPPHYLLQCYHYMAVTGKKAWYIAAVILGRGFTWRKLIWDDKIIRDLTAAEEQFWEGYVRAGILPPPDGSSACDEVIKQYFPEAKKETVELAGFEEKLQRREEIAGLIKGLEAEQKQIEQEIKLSMGEYEAARSGGYRILWGNVDTARLDTKRLKEEKPEIYEAYAKVSRSRRFEIKAA